MLLLSISGVLLYISIDGLKSHGQEDISISALWNLGFGTVASSAIVHLCGGSCGKVIPMILLANSPQVPVSIAYFLYNNILTNMLLAAEYSDYARERKPLRVSWPRGFQRSTYYLSLPYRYGIPLLVAHAGLHWLVSQSLFFVQILPFDIHKNPHSEAQLVACGFSSIAIIFGIILGSLMVCTILGLGLRRFRTNIPLAASCSAAISAACHPPPDDGHALKPVMWGEIPKAQAKRERTSSEADENDPLHCSYTLDIGDCELAEDDLNPASNQRQGDQNRAQFLSEENDHGNEDYAGYGHCHCSFSSREVITPSSQQCYA